MAGCTEAELLAKVNTAAESMGTFYKQGFINYRGRTSDTGELCTEIIARWCCDNLDRFNDIPQITRACYRTPGHDGTTEAEWSDREEERIALAMFRQGELPVIGKVEDYQTPLKSIRADAAGKIDLLAWDGTVLRILELKRPNSRETMLRCVLEGETYRRTVNRENLLKSFDRPENGVVRACPFVFKGGAQWREMQEDRPELKKLMKLLDSQALYISEENGIYAVEV